jgi:murein DD-endopeptidase MepM/ murein hydrolase activator NlpD
MLTRLMRYLVATAVIAACGFLASAGLADTTTSSEEVTATTAPATTASVPTASDADGATTPSEPTASATTTAVVGTDVGTTAGSTGTVPTTASSGAAATTAPATTATTTAALVPPSRRGKSLASVPLVVSRPRLVSGGCAAATSLLIARPSRAPFSVGPLAAHSRKARSRAAEFSYPAAGTVARFGSVQARASGCGSQLRASVTVRSLVLFGGAVRARSLSVASNGSDTSWRVRGLVVLGRRVSVRTRFRLGGWGVLLVRTHGKDGSGRAVLRVRLTRPHAQLPAGTVIEVASLIGVPAAPAIDGSAVESAARALAKRVRAKHPFPGPLSVTPKLNGGPYVFPLPSEQPVYDSYGAFRSDTGWHHGDDLFASLGTPVLAVADGTVHSVGWERLGGWRLWLKDGRGNRFYYAHLSAYTSLAQNGTHVRAGQVLGFVGNTGDAITTPYHLHFEIHPRSLRRLGYDGAVDPTTYLEAWSRITDVRAPAPVLDPPGGPPAPAQRVIARQELLAVAEGGIHAEAFLGKLPAPRTKTPADASPRPQPSTGGGLRSAPRALVADIGGGSGFSTTSVVFALLALLSTLSATALRLLGPRRALSALLVLGSRPR